MPPLPNVPEVCKVEIAGTYHDSKWVNIYYVHYTGAVPTATQLGVYLNDIDAALAANYSAEMSVDNEITSYTMTDLSTDTGAVNEKSVSHFGVRTGDFNPANVCMVGSLTIPRRYRGGHPRKYLPWGTAGTFASGSTIDWDSGFVTDCQAKFSNVLAGFIGNVVGSTTWDQNVNVSYRTAGAVRPTALVDVVSGGIIRTRICSQRRRLGKVGG